MLEREELTVAQRLSVEVQILAHPLGGCVASGRWPQSPMHGAAVTSSESVQAFTERPAHRACFLKLCCSTWSSERDRGSLPPHSTIPEGSREVALGSTPGCGGGEGGQAPGSAPASAAGVWWADWTFGQRVPGPELSLLAHAASVCGLRHPHTHWRPVPSSEKRGPWGPGLAVCQQRRESTRRLLPTFRGRKAPDLGALPQTLKPE